RRLRVAHHAAEPTQLCERLETEDIVADAVGEHECGTGAVEGAREALPEALRSGEADVDERLERRVRRRLAYGLLETRHGDGVVLELGEDEESLGAQRTARPGEQIGRVLS